MNSPTHPTDDDHAAFAIGALDADEVPAYEEHLHTCDSCRARLDWFRPAVDLLPASVEPVEPPPGLRTRLLAEAAADRSSVEAEARERSRFKLGSWRLDWRPLALSAAAAATLAVVVTSALQESSPVRSSTVAARPTNAAPPGLVSATLERQSDVATLHVDRLPRLPQGNVYETWIERNGVMKPGSVFVLRRDGSADAAVPGPLAGARAVLVTREPSGGSTSPTSSPLLRAAL
jgi:anti-sigma-K factor RskA